MNRACWSHPSRFLLIATLIIPGCSAPKAEPSAPPPPQVVVGVPLTMPIVEWDEYVGRLDAIDFVEVRARVSGYLESTNFDEGQTVREGDLLCVIDRKPFVAEVNRAKADVAEAQAKVEQSKAAVIESEADQKAAKSRTELARRQLERSRRLMTQNATTREDVDLRESEYTQAVANQDAATAKIESFKAARISAEAAEETAKAFLAIAELNLSYTEIHAPITGRISRREVTEGNLISGGTAAQATLLTTIVSLNPIHCYFDADEQAFLKYTRLAEKGVRPSSRDVKNPIFMSLADETKGFPHQGHMDFVDNRLDPETGTMRGRAILPNTDLTLTPGLFTRVRLPGSPRYDAVLIPDMAVGTDQSEKFVFILDKSDTVKRQPVVLGPIAKGLRVIKQGLKGTERVVLRGLQRLRPEIKAVPTTEEIKSVDDGLPTEYHPVPESEWLAPRRSKMTTKSAPVNGGVPAAPAPAPAQPSTSNAPEQGSTPKATENERASQKP